MRHFWVLLIVFAAATVSAQSNRTFVSGHGDDTAACTPVAPCRSFSHAISVTNPGGEVIVLDSAGYGVLNIGQAVSITAPDGIYAGITATTGTAVTINASGARVMLKGLTINGAGATVGIDIVSAERVSIDSITINQLEGEAASGNTGIRSSFNAQVSIANSVIRNVLNSLGFTYAIRGFAGTMTIEHCRIETSNHGIGAFGAEITVRDTVIADTLYSGVVSDVPDKAVDVENCDIHGVGGNGALIAGSGGIIRVGRSMITRNARAYQDNGGSSFIYSWGDNHVAGNTNVSTVTGLIAME